MSLQIHHSRKLIRVLILGTGQMGSGIARLVLEKQGLELVGAYGRRTERAGIDLGRAIGLERNLDVRISNDLPATIDETRPRLAIQATCSRLTDAAEEISLLVRHGIHVISIAEEMAFPTCASPALAEELHKLALEHGVSILGTGINPGFVLDLLVIALTGACANIDTITATRINDLSPYGPTVLQSQGIGLTPEEFRAALRAGRVVGHIGFQESAHMIAHAVGWTIDRVTETREPIISQVLRKTPFVPSLPAKSPAVCTRQRLTAKIKQTNRINR
jgi:4-hydroxy-tetrahydrodipicolinate reductase